MSSVSWHRQMDEGSSDEDDVVVMQSFNENDSSQRLLDNDAPVCVQRGRRSVRKSVGGLSTVERSKDEKKYKNSLVSILIIGICLIMMVNIGLGLRKCQSPSEIPHDTLLPKKSCKDPSSGVIFPWQNFRLPTALSPESYHIFLHPNLTLKTYIGKVTINFTANRDADHVILHSRNQVIKSAKLVLLTSNGGQKSLKQLLTCQEYQTVSFYFDYTLIKGITYQLVVDYSGNLTFSLGGFYLSTYKKSNNQEGVIGTTQFESTDARAAFPCFDEPAFKANFSLSLVRNQQMHTLFNMPLRSSNSYENGLELDEFPSTVKMSTYLVAFIVSDFKNITNTTKSGVKVSIFTAPDKVNDAKFALDVAVNVLSYYENLFKLPFPLPKMDLVAIPDFAAGAMENWGLVTYRETALLYNPLTSSVADQEWVAIVIAHELSHQWFGNLVTMEWWNDLWLNEGFASYMEYAGVDKLKPEWEIMTELATSTVSRAMATDSSMYTHPISVNINSLEEIDEVFDDISYSKGACMIAMLYDFLGEKFFEGVNTYLKKFEFANAGNGDLIKAVTDANKGSNVNIQDMMNTWTRSPGFPLVKVSVKGNQVFVEQSRFLYPTKDNRLESASLWQIPLTYVTNNAPDKAKRYFFTWKKSTITLSGNPTWIKFNHNFTGYYRVSYDDASWIKLIDQLLTDHTVFTINDRVSILSDAFVMARVGELSYGNIFKMLAYVNKETEYGPINTAMNGLGYINHIFRVSLNEQGHRSFETYVNHIFSNFYNELAWKNRTGLDRNQQKVQANIVSFACSLNHPPCIKEAYNRFKGWKNEETDILPDYMYPVFKSGATNGVEEDWQHLWTVFTSITDATMKSKILSAVATSTDLTKVLFLQEEFLKGETIRSQDASSLVRSLTSNLVGGSLTWKFIKQHWEDVLKNHPVASFATRSIVKSCLSTILDDGEVAGAEAFFTLKGVDGMKFFKRALETTRINIYWAKKHLPEISKWLQENKHTWNDSTK